MSTMPQNETHPDAEALSAFAEQALGENERGEVLKHLAGCGRCRQIVALAGDVADAKFEPARQPVAPRTRRSWKGWALALSPIAAVGATAAIAIYLHERSLERSAEVAQIERQRAEEKPPLPPPASPQTPAPAAAPDKTPSGAPATNLKKERSVEEPRVPLDETNQPSAAPPPAPESGLLAMHDRPTEPSEAEQHKPGDDETPAPDTEHDGARPQQAAVYDSESKRHAEEKLDRRLFAVTAPAPEDKHVSEGSGGESSTPASAEPAADSRAQLQAPAEGSSRLHGLSSMANLSARPRVFHLPSERPAVSIASRDRRVLAVDDAGNLFLSEDSGKVWEKVERQWAGSAVAVREHGREADATESAQAPGSAGVIARPGAVSHSDTVFELVNDESQVWVSEDGRIWTAR